MTRIATMGTSSCATIALAGFKQGQEDINENYLANKKPTNNKGMDVKAFYDKIIYPTSQPLGHTKEYAFDELMEAIENSSLASKFIIVTLNDYQENMKDKYWPGRLKHWGFTKIDKTKNSIGTVNHIYTVNPSRVD
jgi:hypothetical protein